MSIETYKSIDKIDYQDLENKDLVECCGGMIIFPYFIRRRSQQVTSRKNHYLTIIL